MVLLDETVLAGWFGGRGFIAAELGWEHMLLTSLRPTDRYRAIHPAAPDAWFANTGGHLRAGAQGGAGAWAPSSWASASGWCAPRPLRCR